MTFRYNLKPFGWLVIALAALLTLTTGCASMFTANTKASYRITNKDGVVTEVLYESDKEQQGLRVEIDPTTGKVTVWVDKAGTQEAVIAAVAEQQKAMADILKAVAPLAAKAGSL